jgi:hypothetical protein
MYGERRRTKKGSPRGGSTMFMQKKIISHENFKKRPKNGPIPRPDILGPYTRFFAKICPN